MKDTEYSEVLATLFYPQFLGHYEANSLRSQLKTHKGQEGGLEQLALV